MSNINWRKTIRFLIICIIIGGIAGVGLRFLMNNTQPEVTLYKLMELSPYLFLISTLLGGGSVIGVVYFNKKLKKELYSDEETSFYAKNEIWISYGMSIATLGTIINFLAFGLSINQQNILTYLFILNCILALIGEVSYISLIQKVRPDLKTDPMDVNFSKNHFEKMDEGEQYKVGRASFKTIAYMTPVYVGVFLACYSLTIYFEISPLICLPVGLLWATQTVMLTYYSLTKN